MKFMLLVYMAEDAMNPDERQQCIADSTRLAHALHASGQYLAASPLDSVSTATSLQVRGDKQFVTDGPFAETREHLGGFYVIDANNLDEAIEIGARHPGARWGTVEIRPIREIPGLPNG